METKHTRELKEIAEELRKQSQKTEIKSDIGKHLIERGLRITRRFLKFIEDGLKAMTEAFPKKRAFITPIPDRLDRIAKDLEGEK